MKGYFYLAFRKLKDNKVHSTVLILCVVLASLLILVLGNIGYYMGQNVENILTNTGQVVDIYIDSSVGMFGIEPWTNTGKLQAVIDKLEEYDSSFCYSSNDVVSLNTAEKQINAKAYFVEGMDKSFEIVIQTDTPIVGTEYIWMPESAICNIGDVLRFEEGDLTVVGKVKGEMAYIDKSKVPMWILSGVADTKIESMSTLRELEKLDKQIAKMLGVKFNKEEERIWIGSSVLNNYYYIKPFNLMVNGICALLLLVSIALVVLCLVNSVKINSEKDTAFFGMLKSQGIDDNGIMWYSFFQYIFYILIGTMIASCISAIILHFGLGMIMNIIFNLIGAGSTEILAGYCWWMPLVSGLIMMAICMLVAKIESIKMSKQDIALLMKGEL